MNQVGLADAIDAIRQVLQAHVERGVTLPPFVVLLGGTALAAHDVRDLSDDLDFYAPTFDPDLIMEVEASLKGRYGPLFKIDATAAENVWGSVLIRDIAASRTVSELRIESSTIAVKLLSLEDIYLLKLYAGRDKDAADLEALAIRVQPDSLVTRFETYARWHADPHHLVGFVDRFVSEMGTRFGVDELALIGRLNVSRFVRVALVEARLDADSLDA